jgi:hypothetical protein
MHRVDLPIYDGAYEVLAAAVGAPDETPHHSQCDSGPNHPGPCFGGTPDESGDDEIEWTGPKEYRLRADEPTDDDLAIGRENRRGVLGPLEGSPSEIIDQLRELLANQTERANDHLAAWKRERAEVERLRAAAPASEDDEVTRSEMVERFRKALMQRHHDDWDMETVAEAAHICAEELWPR